MKYVNSAITTNYHQKIMYNKRASKCIDYGKSNIDLWNF